METESKIGADDIPERKNPALIRARAAPPLLLRSFAPLLLVSLPLACRRYRMLLVL
jgi:hypothetical protein